MFLWDVVAWVVWRRESGNVHPDDSPTEIERFHMGEFKLNGPGMAAEGPIVAVVALKEK